MNQIIIVSTIVLVQLFSGAVYAKAGASRATCVNALASLMDGVENDIRGMPKKDAEVHKYCVMWLYNRSQYDKAKSAGGGEDPCPSNASDWKTILKKLMNGYSSAKTVCSDKNTCSKGCGDALKIIRNGGSQSKALAAIPKD